MRSNARNKATLQVFLKSRQQYYLDTIRWIHKHIGPYQMLIALSVLTGMLSGFAATVLKKLLHYVETQAFLFFPSYLLFLTPLTGIMLVTFIHQNIFKSSGKFHGVGEVIMAISKRSAILNFSLTYAKLITSALTVGMGGSSGLESPIVVTGAAIGSNLARLFRLEINYRILFIGCGASAGIAAIFNAPIAGVIFAMEVIMPKLTATYFIPVLLSAASGALLSGLFAAESLFSVPLSAITISIKEVPYFIVIGIAGGFMSLYFTQLSWASQSFFQRFRNPYFRALCGGSILGLMILLFPRLYGEGYIGVSNLFVSKGQALLPPFLQNFSGNVNYILPLVFTLLMLLKPIASNITLQSGGDGGNFAPSFITGAYMGYSIYLIALNFIPGMDMPVSAFILLGMAAVLSGVMHAPLTGIFLVAEISGGYLLLVPLMLVSAIAFFTKIYFERQPLHFPKKENAPQLMQHEWAEFQSISVISLSDTDYLYFSPQQSLKEMAEVIAKSKKNIYPVLDEDHVLLGMITIDELRPYFFELNEDKKIIAKNLMHLPTTFISAEDNLPQALQKFDESSYWHLPVLNHGKFVGIISKSVLLEKVRYEIGKNDSLF